MDFKINTNASIISKIEQNYTKKDVPDIRVGDTLQIGLLIQEGSKERVQFSEGVVISKNNSSLNTTVTLRKVLQGVGVEKVYLIHSPRIKEIRITRRSKVRRAKLYYLRERSGKATRLKQKFA
uniref:Ribosomal protein L19 n=1 Tax=Ahnfeltia plicata TaxID=28023 RepID=A0A1C9CB76_9FLOR|nr:ribosomal protein L19 [Ahnfeltia plicata]AOM65650.1 ribosomal protein L19 [Ahnfeltia plicata]UAT97239.1 ribosomal protein L19 [Ahnfeltia plicata]UAT97444.1 ribosomal protein L19 [Ahnfeltia plicata]